MNYETSIQQDNNLTTSSDIIEPSGLMDDTDYNNIQFAINTGNCVLSSGTFSLTKELILPEDKAIMIKGAGFEKTFLKVVNSNSSIIKKCNSFVLGNTIQDLTLDGNLKCDNGIKIVASKQMKIGRVRIQNTLGDSLCFGGDSSNAFYEAQITDVMIEGASFDPDKRPDYGIHMLVGAHDSYINNLVIKNIKLAGVKEDEASNNIYDKVHVYGYPEPDFRNEYSMDIVGQCVISQLYSDSPSIAGIRIGGTRVSIIDSIFFWLTKNDNAYAYEIGSSVNYLTILGNQYINMSNEKSINFTGRRQNDLTIFSKDYMLLSGILEIQQSTNQAARVKLNVYNGANAFNEAQTDNKTRWRYGKANAVEIGNNVGSDFVIERYDDGGNYINTAFTIARNSGITTINGGLNITGTYQNPLRINGNYIWADSSNNLWFKPVSGSVPTSETDGKMIIRLTSAPATSTSAGVWGQFAIDSNYLYIATGTNTWKRTALTSW